MNTNGPPTLAVAAEEPARLLVVDDIEMNCDLMTLQLQRHGYRVSATSSGADALARVEAEHFDLLLLDIRMPGMDGLEALRRLRENHSALNLPVIMVTADAMEESVVEAMQIGANDYLVKPLSMPVAVARIEAQLTLQRMAGIKDDLVRFASHDLKKPLLVMMDMAQTLKQDLQPGQPVIQDNLDVLQMLLDTGHNMQRVISGFLDRESLRQGQIEPMHHAVDINGPVQSAIDGNRDYAASKGITLTGQLGDALPRVQANDFRLLQIMDNLIGNALKFSPQGSSVTVRTAVDGETQVCVEVIDSGPGLRDEDFPLLFVKHARLSNHPTGNETSTGVGLALCKQLIKMDNGHIGARNNPQGGATFWIRLPLH